MHAAMLEVESTLSENLSLSQSKDENIFDLIDG
jgi:hypothetical protein